MSNPGTIIPAGKRFGHLTVLGLAPSPRRGRFYNCRCDCGNDRVAYAGHLRAGQAVSCGCIKTGWGNRTHGFSHKPEYLAWENARARCRNPANRKYPLYGGRGVTMCEKWLNSFEAFIEDMGARPGPGYSLDRIDGNKGYTPENCRWADIFTQNRNRTFHRGSNA